MYQKCPVCEGKNLLVEIISSTSALPTYKYQICKTCNGSGIIDADTGLPPKAYIETFCEAFMI